MFDYNQCAKCGAQWPEREGLECRVCEKPTTNIERTTMKADDVYRKIILNQQAHESEQRAAFATCMTVIEARLRDTTHLGPHSFDSSEFPAHTDLGLLVKVLNNDGFDAKVIGERKPGGAQTVTVTVPVPKEVLNRQWPGR